MRLRTQLMIVALGCLMLTGCVKDSVDLVDRNWHTFTYQGWVPFLAFTLTIAGGAYSWSVRHYGWRANVGMATAAVFFFIVVPSICLDWVTVNTQHFEGRIGLWFFPTRFDVPFDEVSSVRITISKAQARRSGPQKNESIRITLKSGEHIHLPGSNHVVAAARDLILGQILARKVSINRFQEP
jgi:hypothetical protein